MNGWVKLFWALAIVVLTTLCLLPFQLIALFFRLNLARKIPVLWHRITCWAIGMRVHKVGQLTSTRPLLIAANHVSWSDIVVLGSLGELSFIAKREVSEIFGINLLAWLQRSVFVARERPQHSGKQVEEIAARLQEGDAMVLFAEGTTGDGNRLLEFKSTLFGAAQYVMKETTQAEIAVQPVAIRYVSLHGIPLGRRGRNYAAWTGDEELGPHLSYFVRSGAWNVEVLFGAVISFGPDAKRCEIAEQSRSEIRKMLATRPKA